MRVLFCLYSERTHFYSVVPLAWAFAAAGHEVRVASQPALTPLVTGAGLSAVPVGEDHQLRRMLTAFPRLLQHAGGFDLPPFTTADREATDVSWEELRDGYANFACWWFRLVNEPMAQGLVDFARQWRPDLVVWEPGTFVAGVAAASVDARHVRILGGSDFYARVREHFLAVRAERPAERTEDPLGEWVAQLAGRHGVEYREELLTGQATIDQLPASFRLRTDVDYLAMRYVPYNGPAAVAGWLRERPERARVAVTLGHSQAGLGGSDIPLPGILRSLADDDVEVVVATGDSELAARTDLPANVRHVGVVPLNELAATCSLVVHHGGFGSIATALRWGVPQLALPEQHDAHIMSRGLVARGAGALIPGSEAAPDRVRAEVLRLLASPAAAAGARGLRNELAATPSPSDVVATLATASA
ncbi:activator-dependent family glycosyltransferase [Spiractinospora alimapuensis]|uniref:activator-dependent family glycosyltransferase n=1 Tax=Spiractinospora alimapuensis TaxID=2820884 RepID=UPI001F234F14|nr:activator-dependent family glycosyltransferase [Spiractinospora alimapuensis]QVQ51832.1 activator-dependent family glycosyltransferase [Spiractinospora alimapuensis]